MEQQTKWGSLDEALQAVCNRTLASHDKILRNFVFDTVVAPNMARLRGGNDRKWNTPGWYMPIEPVQPLKSPRDAFPVPDSCSNWYAPEHDPRHGESFRFFVRRAWLELPVPVTSTILSFVVAHVVMQEVVACLAVSVNRVPVAYKAEPYPYACAKVDVVLTPDMIETARCAGHLRLDLDVPVEAIPALIYPDTKDYRHLSMAICFPRFGEGTVSAQ